MFYLAVLDAFLLGWYFFCFHEMLKLEGEKGVLRHYVFPFKKWKYSLPLSVFYPHSPFSLASVYFFKFSSSVLQNTILRFRERRESTIFFFRSTMEKGYYLFEKILECRGLAVVRSGGAEPQPSSGHVSSLLKYYSFVSFCENSFKNWNRYFITNIFVYM